MENLKIVDGVVVSYSGNEENVVIPSSVTEIGPKAFCENESIKTVTFSSSLKVIHERAFQDCTSLCSVSFNEGLEKIDHHAFFNCPLTNVCLPSSLSILGYLSFSGGQTVKEINVKEDNLHFSSVDGVLYNKEKTALLMYPECSDIKEYETLISTKRIEDYAFAGINKKDESQVVKFNEGIEKIGEGAFLGSGSYKKVFIPSSLKEIGENAFNGFGFRENGKIYVKKNSCAATLFDKYTDIVEFIV